MVKAWRRGKPRLYDDSERAIIPGVPDIDWIRKLCLSLPGTTENMQWGEALCFKVRGKLFVVADLSQGKLAPITFKCTPERFNELLEIEGISPAPYVGRYKWVRLSSTSVLRDEELEDLMRQSYELVVAKVPKAAKAPKKKARKKALSRKRHSK
jgi:predicted DNA-binding protein (MmcQ/YjbR family)